MTLFINYTGNNLSITFCTVCNPCLFSSLHLSLIRYGICFQTKLLSRLSPRFCRFLSSHFRPKGSQICIFIYNTRQISWNTCVYFPFPNVDLGITVVSVLQNTVDSTLRRENAHFRGENSVTYKSQDFSRKFERNGVCFNDLWRVL